MTTALPLNRLGIETAEVLGLAGDLSLTTTPLGGGGIYNPAAFIDVAAYPELRLRSLSDVASAAGGVQLEWSFDGVTVAQTDTLGAALAATLFDSGALGRTFNWVRPKYTNGAGPQASFRCALSGYPGASAYTVAAIGALFPVRAVDAGNSSVAALGAGGTFVGPWTARGQKARIDIALTVAAATNLIVEHTDNVGLGAEAALTETWAATGAHPSFPTNLPRLWYRVRLTDTGGGGAVTLATFSDPEPADHDAPLLRVYNANVLNGTTIDYVVPLGSRRAVVHNRQHASVERGSTLAGSMTVWVTTGAAGYASMSIDDFGDRSRLQLVAGDGVHAHNTTGLAMDLTAFFYP